MPVTITKGQLGYIDPQTQYADSGWEISGKYATHYPCFSGYMQYLASFPFVDGNVYDVTYVVDNYSSGLVRSEFGKIGINNTGNGTYTDIYTFTTGNVLKFFSDGGVRITLLQISLHQSIALNNGQTFSFNETSNKWVQNYSFLPDCMIKFSDRLFTFKNGQSWEHDTNQVRNNFYGIQYPFQITFIVNVDFQKDKLFFNMRLDAKGKWSAPLLQTVGSNQFPDGMQSRLKAGNFKQIDGKLWADILFDLTDPNFTDQLQALFNGRKMQGGWLVVNLECNNTDRAEISSIETYYTETEKSI